MKKDFTVKTYLKLIVVLLFGLLLNFGLLFYYLTF